MLLSKSNISNIFILKEALKLLMMYVFLFVILVGIRNLSSFLILFMGT